MSNLIEIHQHTGEGYSILFDFEHWRIGYLRESPIYLPEGICEFQRHENCDEAFVLLSGHCCLLVADGGDEIGPIEGCDLEALKVYNIKQGVWHSHIVSKGGAVLVVENSDMELATSPLKALSEDQRREIMELAGKLTWLGGNQSCNIAE